MKKNYVKPILLSETFVTENIMNGTDMLSTMNNVTLWSLSSGNSFTGITFNAEKGGNTIHTIKFSDFQPEN